MNKENSVARFFFKQSCIFLSTESRALTGCAIPCSKSIRELEAHESARGARSSVGDLDKSRFAFLSVQLSYQSYRTVFYSSAGLSYHFFVCERCMYKIEKKNIAFCVQKQLIWKKLKRRRIRANRRLSFFSCSLFPFVFYFDFFPSLNLLLLIFDLFASALFNSQSDSDKSNIPSCVCQKIRRISQI